MRKTTITKTKRILASVLVGLLGFTITPTVINSIDGQAASAVVKDGVILESYAYNTAFSVPEVTIETEEGEVKCSNASIIFPDGTGYTGNTFLLTQCGTYTLVYDTGKYQASKSFNVYDDSWVLSSSASKAEFVEAFDYTRYVREYVKDGETLEFAMRLDNKRGGISLDLAAGDTFTYNVPINLNEVDGLMDVIQCYPEIWDKETNKAAAKYVTVKLIDCYDSSNYVEFLWGSLATGAGVYGSAGGSNQQPVGLEWQQYNGYKYNTFNYEDGYYTFHKIDINGTTQQYGTSLGNPSQTTENNLLHRGGMNFQYDPVDKKVFSTYTMAKKNNAGAYVYDETTGYLIEQDSYKRLITDLDDPILCEDRDREAFEGFTTGECYLSIQTYGNYSNSIHIDIESIFGRGGSELQAEAYVDKLGPKLTFVDGNSYDKPVYIQKNVAVSLPVAKAVDVNGNGLYTVTVYSNYGTAYQTKVTVTDNMFTPDSNATYAAVYKATDNYGNVTEKVINFVVSDKKAISYEENKLDSLKGGDINVFPSLNAVGTNGGVTVTLTITNPKGETVTIDNDTLTYIPEYLGEYTVNYVLTDGIAVNYFTYKVNCEDSGKVSFKDEIFVEKYFIKNATYGFEDYYAYTVSNEGLTPQLCNVYVSLDGGEFAKVENAKAFQVTANTTVDVKMEYKGQFSEATQVQVVDANYNAESMAAEDFAKYFMNENAEFNADASAFYFKFDGNSKQETLRYVNPLSLSNFSLAIVIPNERNEDGTRTYFGEFSKMEIKLIDYYDESISISSIYETNKKGMTYTVEKSSFTFDGIAMKDINDTIYVQNGTINNGKRSDKGIELPAFTGDLCYLEITLSGISGKAGVGIKKINNQNFNQTIKHGTKSIGMHDNVTGAFGQGSEYQITPISVTNVLNPILKDEVTISVTSPRGKVVTAKNGVKLDNAKNDYYTIDLEEVGNYKINYRVTLPDGTTEIISSMILSIDVEGPTVTFDKGYTEDTLVTINRGATHTVSYTVSDDNTDEEKLMVTLMFTTSEGSFVGIGGDSFTFVEAGSYRVLVLAMDERGNTTTAYYNVLVK